MTSAPVKPVTAEDKKLSKKHLKETIKFNTKKAKDHEKAAKKTSNTESQRFNRAHAENHFAEAKKSKQMLKDGKYIRI